MLPQAMEMANTMPSVWMRCSFSPDGTFGVMLKCLPRWVGRWVTQQHCRPGRFVGGVGWGQGGVQCSTKGTMRLHLGQTSREGEGWWCCVQIPKDARVSCARACISACISACAYEFARACISACAYEFVRACISACAYEFARACAGDTRHVVGRAVYAPTYCGKNLSATPLNRTHANWWHAVTNNG